MRTTLIIPPELLKEAQNLLGIKSKTDTVILSLRELIRRKRLDELKQLSKHIHLDIDLDRSRRRASRKKI
jgi:Arc/MetJ family transcription regulator